MNILILTNDNIEDPELWPEFFTAAGHKTISHTKRIDMDFVTVREVDFILSDRHCYLVREPVITAYEGRLINLHPSLLPWNRGYFPNLWSVLEGTPSGITIHRIDANIDTGDILLQEELFFTDEDTLRTSHDRLKAAIEKLFMSNWEAIRDQTLAPRPQDKNAGTLHFKRDFERVKHLLTEGWDTPIGKLRNLIPVEKNNT